MLFMNDYDLDHARGRFTRATTPNRLALVMVVDNLREWADSHSDGWHSWPKPAQAARLAMEHIESRTNRENDWQERNDVDDGTMRRAVMPIRAFLTRQKVDAEWRERILRAVEAEV